MTESNPSIQQTDLLLRLARRNLYVVLFMIVLFGATLLSSVIAPTAPLSTWSSRAPWLIPVAIVFFVVVSASGARRWKADSPEVKIILNDEFRRASLNRALRVAFTVALIAQVPQALLFSSLPPFRAVMGMAAATITLAMATLITFFLLFDREGAHE
jgi:hypothetical protein